MAATRRAPARRVVSLVLPVLAFGWMMTAFVGALSAAPSQGVVLVPVEQLAAVNQLAKATIAGFEYHPRELRIKPGTTVVWLNGDRFDHDVMIVGSKSPAPEDVKSALVNFNERIAMTFNEPGTYMYICSVHPFMQGSVIVEPAGSRPE